MAERYNMNDTRLEYGKTDHFTCPYCYKTISASRPPVHNADNCSCDEAAAFRSGIQQTPQASIYEYRQPMYQVQSTPEVYNYRPEFYASSSGTVSSPEGPEIEQPNLNITNEYLPLSAEPGLNELEHRRRSSSFYSNMPYQMRRYLVDPEYQQHTDSNTSTVSSPSFLPQDIHIQSPAPPGVGKSSKKSQDSRRSKGSSGSGDGGFVGCSSEFLAGIGIWDEEGAGAVSYPMAISGVFDECVFDDDE